MTEKWIRKYKEIGAIFIHGVPVEDIDKYDIIKQPHPVLTSKLHSNAFFNSGKMMENTYLLRKACQDLVFLLKKEDKDLFFPFDRVVGPAEGAITLACLLALVIGDNRGFRCLTGYAKKGSDGINEGMYFDRIDIQPTEKILLIEDVITTGNSLRLVEEAVNMTGATCLDVICTLINRTGKKKVNDKKIISLINYETVTWTPEECPYCKKHSPVIDHPKMNWQRLNAKY